MKKTITLLAIAALITTASFAQNNHQRDNNYDQRDNNYGNNRDREIAANNSRERNGNYGYEKGSSNFTTREKNIQIASINSDYDRRIESVRNKFFMPRPKKERLIYSLEMQRDAEIRSVLSKYNNSGNNCDRREERYHNHDHNDRHNW